jgi:hypothetical protein
MKQYKLLKDLPYAKAGEVFERTTHKSEDGLSDYDYLEIRKRVSVGEDETHFGIQYNYFLNNFNEWFEEIEESTDSIHWKPKQDEKIWYLDENGAPEQHKDLSILGCEIEVDGVELNLDEYRDPSGTDKR